MLSSPGTRPARHAITLCSASTAAVIAAMRQHHATRLITVSSSVLDPLWRPSGELMFNNVIDPLINRRIARTAHQDMRRMEELLRNSDLEWTAARPSGLFSHPAVTRYQVHRDRADGLYTARIDLAAAMVTELTERRFVREALAIITTDQRPTIAGLLGYEAVRRRREQRTRARPGG